MYIMRTASKVNKSYSTYFASSTSYKVVRSTYFAHGVYIMYVNRIYLLFQQCVCAMYGQVWQQIDNLPRHYSAIGGAIEVIS